MDIKKRFVLLLLLGSIFMGTGFAFATSGWPQPEVGILAYNSSDLVPPTGTIVINGGVALTKLATVNLTLGATDNTATVDFMSFSDNGAAWTAWEPYATAKARVLPSGDGNKTVWARFLDTNDNISTAVFDTIFLDTTKPLASVKAPAKVSRAAGTVRFRVSWTGWDSGSGVKDYDVAYRIGKRGRWKSWKTGVTALRARFTAKTGKTYFFRARAEDKAGNIGAWSRLRRTVVKAL